MAEAPQGFNLENIQHAQIRCLSDAPWADFHRQLDAYWYGKKRGKIATDMHFIYVDRMGYGVIDSPQDFGVLDVEKFNILHELYWHYRMVHFNVVNNNYPAANRVPDSDWNNEVILKNGTILTELAYAEIIIQKRKEEGIVIKLLLELGV